MKKDASSLSLSLNQLLLSPSRPGELGEEERGGTKGHSGSGRMPGRSGMEGSAALRHSRGPQLAILSPPLLSIHVNGGHAWRFL